MRDEAGINTRPSEQNIKARIEAVEKLLRIENGLLIDPSCTRLINGFLGGYCYKETATGIYSDQPEKNKFAHIQDAFQYVAVKIALTDHDSAFGSFDLAACAA